MNPMVLVEQRLAAFCVCVRVCIYLELLNDANGAMHAAAAPQSVFFCYQC